jgi:AI-2 transport protein TqsA
MTNLQSRILIVLLSIVALVLVVAGLRATYYVSMPLVFAFFVTVLVWPMHDAMQRRLPDKIWWLSVVATLGMILAVLGAFVGAMWFAIYRIAGDRFDQYRQRGQMQWQQIQHWLRERGVPIGNEEGQGVGFTQLGEWAHATLMGASGLITVMVLIILFVVLMLIEAHHWKAKSRRAMPRDRSDSLLDAMDAITRQVRTFLLVQAMISFMAASVTGIWLLIMGVPFVLILTLATFLLDFVPNIGPILAGTLVSLVALVTEGVGTAIIVAVGVFIIQQFFGNYLDPILKGRRMSISPLIVLLSVIFWTWVWGPAGAVLAVPITATLIVVCAHIPTLRPIALMLSRTADQRKLMEQTHGDGSNGSS